MPKLSDQIKPPEMAEFIRTRVELLAGAFAENARTGKPLTLDERSRALNAVVDLVAGLLIDIHTIAVTAADLSKPLGKKG